MKNLIIIVLLFSFIFICSCEDEPYTPEDNISHVIINKTLRAGQIDTIISGCSNLICTIDTTELINKQIKIFTHFTDGCIGGGGIGISANNNKTSSKFSTGDIIGADSNWTTEIFLDNYNFYDDLYIGLKYSYPDGENRSQYYAWLHLSLSEDKQELTIIDMAKNLTEGNSILAGQIE